MLITQLAPHEVFVFGSNAQGFHGAGAAGYACRGDARNNWRQDAWFLKAMDSSPNSPHRIGKWAVYGIARGFQHGREGASYAVQTIERPGLKRSTTRREIYSQLLDLWTFARISTHLSFLLTPLGESYSGWTHEEMAEVWRFLEEKHGWPDNVVRFNAPVTNATT